ncbi:MAG: hypothetical protein WBF70_18020, partial [Aeromonas molluscorum]
EPGYVSYQCDNVPVSGGAALPMFAIAPTSGGGVAIIALFEVINPDVDKEPQMSSTQLVLGALSVLLMATSANGLDGPAMNGARIYFTGTSERGTTAPPRKHARRHDAR